MIATEPAAVFIGWQRGLGLVPDLALYNLTRDIDGHPAGSTVGAKTLAKAGIEIPTTPAQEDKP